MKFILGSPPPMACIYLSDKKLTRDSYHIKKFDLKYNDYIFSKQNKVCSFLKIKKKVSCHDIVNIGIFIIFISMDPSLAVQSGPGVAHKGTSGS